MKPDSGPYILFCILFLVGTAGAAGIPDTLTLTTSTSWITANGVSQSTITVTVQNTTTDPGGVSGVPVTLSVNDAAFGTLSPATVTTNAYGQAATTFRTKTKSGAATITAILPGYPEVANGSVLQNIDHDVPYYDPSFPRPLFTYPSQGGVASEADIRISMHDKWGNAIDNRTGTNHVVTLYVNGPDPDDCGFYTGSGYAHSFSPAIDANGNLTVKVRLTSRIGINYIHMDPIGSIKYQTLTITAVGSGVPVSMMGTVSNGGIYPENKELPANNIDKFTLDYHLYDGFGNVMANESVWISTNITGEQTPSLHTADSNGLIRFYYGPTDSVITANITAVAADNATVKNEITVRFIADKPTNMILAVTPQTMESRDINPGSVAFVRVTVVDNLGNPVAGEPVDFELGTPAGDVPVPGGEPALLSLSAVTDEYGNAIVIFQPGTFPAEGEAGFRPRATGSVVIRATWEGVSKEATVTWKNYPYINIQTSASQTSGLNVNDTVDITVDVIGNGFLTEGGGKIAAIVDIDSSSSIWSNPDDLPSGYSCMLPAKCVREDSAKAAANAFAELMLLPDPTGNWIGINSFGNEKKDDHRLMEPQTSLVLVQAKIANTVKGTNSQGFGTSLTDSIRNLSDSQERRPLDKLRAVIALKDSGGGNLLSNQTPTVDQIITLAKSTDPPTLIFTVYYYDGKAEDPNTINVLKTISGGTNGKFYRAENSAELIQAFIDIANYLKYAAGVQTQLDLNFQNIEVNGNTTPNINAEVVDYVPVGNPYLLSTVLLTRDEVTGRTRVMWPNRTHSVFDQSAEWDATHQLHFNIGVVNISEQWNATYRLKVKKPGFINLFNCSVSPSQLQYKEPYGGFQDRTLCLPDLYLKINDKMELPGDLDISDLTPQSGAFTDSVPLQWNLKYKGYDTVTERYYYAYNPANLPVDNSNLMYREFGSVSGIPSTAGEFVSRTTTLDLNGFYQGPYTIKVVASVPGTPGDTEYGRFAIPYDSESGKINIQLR